MPPAAADAADDDDDDRIKRKHKTLKIQFINTAPLFHNTSEICDKTLRIWV